MKYRIIFQGVSGGWQFEDKEYDSIDAARIGVHKYLKIGYEKEKVLIISIFE